MILIRLILAIIELALRGTSRIGGSRVRRAVRNSIFEDETSSDYNSARSSRQDAARQREQNKRYKAYRQDESELADVKKQIQELQAKKKTLEEELSTKDSCAYVASLVTALGYSAEGLPTEAIGQEKTKELKAEQESLDKQLEQLHKKKKELQKTIDAYLQYRKEQQ